jgi:hypothetical protein
MMRSIAAPGSPTCNPELSHDSAKQGGAILLMIPIMSESFGVFIEYKQKECNPAVCTLAKLMVRGVPFVVLPASGAFSL